MHRESESNPHLEQLSELMDGECDAQGALRACGGWRDDATARRQWHAWHVIGDVLRSEDLVRRPQRDAAFVAALRVRLAAEPIVLAPAPPVDAGKPAVVVVRRRWRSASGTAAIAAGFVVVLGTVAVLRPTPRVDAPKVAAQSQRAAPAPVAVARGVEPQVLVANGQLIRDARLDQYLAAHKQYSPLGMPAAFTQSRPAAAANSSR